MKTWRLVSGTLNLVLFIVVLFQSCAAGFVNAVESNGENSGSAGLIFGALILVAGVLSFAFRNSKDEGSGILIGVYGASAAIGFLFHGIYKDLIVWASWSAICAIVTLVLMILEKRQIGESTQRILAMVFFVVCFAISVLSTISVIAADVLTFVEPSRLEGIPDSAVYAFVGVAVLFGGVSYALAGKAFD